MLTRARAVILAVSMKREAENMRNYVSHLSPWEYVFVKKNRISAVRQKRWSYFILLVWILIKIVETSFEEGAFKSRLNQF